MNVLLLLVLACCALASTALGGEQKTFVNAGLKMEYVVQIEVTGKAARGVFLASEYDREHAKRAHFSGKVVPTPKGGSGVRLEIEFEPNMLADGDAPYARPAGAERIFWTLRLVKHRAHLFIPMSERTYEPRPGKWVVSEVEFLPER